MLDLLEQLQLAGVVTLDQAKQERYRHERAAARRQIEEESWLLHLVDGFYPLRMELFPECDWKTPVILLSSRQMANLGPIEVWQTDKGVRGDIRVIRADPLTGRTESKILRPAEGDGKSLSDLFLELREDEYVAIVERYGPGDELVIRAKV